MTPHNQRVRTRGAARPRNLAVGCLAVLVVLAALALVGRLVRDAESQTAPDVPAPVSSDARP